MQRDGIEDNAYETPAVTKIGALREFTNEKEAPDPDQIVGIGPDFGSDGIN